MTARVPAIALLRNLNHGQRNSPTGEQLVAAFVEAGATDVRTVAANGTVVLTTADPARCTALAVATLSSSTSWHDVGFVLPVDTVAAVLPEPVDGVRDARAEFSAFAPGGHPDAPLVGRRCTVTAIGDGWALTDNERDGESRATPTLERALGRPVTSRAVRTLRRALAVAGQQ